MHHPNSEGHTAGMFSSPSFGLIKEQPEGEVYWASLWSRGLPERLLCTPS